MTNNRDLLKEAIADAKSVKETAIANAKLALEEAFTPYLQDQLSAKLQEMDDEDDKDVKEEKKEEVKEMEAKKEKVDEINLDELLAELELDEDEKTDAEEEGYEDGMEDEKEDIDDEEVDLEDLSEDDLKSFIEDVIKDMVAAGEIEPGDEFADEDVDVDVEVEDEDVDVEVEDEDVDVEVELDEGYSNKDGDKDDSPTEKKSQKGRFAKNGDVSEADRFKEEMNVDVEVDESLAVAAGVASVFGGAVALDKAMDALEAGKLGEKGKAFASFLRSQGKAAAGRYSEGVEEDLGEIEELKQELQEVNLLNAKLLYTNKIFKAKNLTESKKVKVLKAFDKATDVKQAKAIYETLNEGIVNTITNSRVNESVKRGAASKASGLEPKANKQPILESNEVYDRMRKLAGLI